MNIERIISERLVLIPLTREVAAAVLIGRNEVLEELGLKVDESWPDKESLETLPKIIKILESVKEPSGFEAWLVVKRDAMTVIGDAGFKGKPDEKGGIDIGYSIIAQEQKKGYGFETAKALADWAFLQGEVRFISASCLLGNKGSARILEKLGMQETSRDETMIYWKVSRPV